MPAASEAQHPAEPDPRAWLSPRRQQIRLLARQRAQLGPLAIAQPTELITKLHQIGRERIKLLDEARTEHGLRNLVGRRARVDAIEAKLHELEQIDLALRAQVEAFRIQTRDAWDEYEPIDREWKNEVELAAEEESSLRIRKDRAPWIRNMIGAPPPPRRRDLVVRSELLVRYVAANRIQQDILNPSDPGITTENSTLMGDIRTIRGHIEDAAKQGPAARKFEPYARRKYQPGALDLPGHSERDR